MTNSLSFMQLMDHYGDKEIGLKSISGSTFILSGSIILAAILTGLILYFLNYPIKFKNKQKE